MLLINKKIKTKLEISIRSGFNKGKINPDAFAKKMNIEISNHHVQEELDKHYQWKKYNQLSVTPTILINGYLLPENYNVEDLEYFCNINLTVSN